MNHYIFFGGRGTGMATLKANLDQQLAGLFHEPLFQVFLDVRKAYYLLEKGICLDILRGYKLGKQLARLIFHYWEKHIIVPTSGKFLGRPFVTGRGVTQGNPELPMIFNIVVDAVVQAVLEEVCGIHEAHHRLGWATGESNLVFYVDDVRITERYPDWVQDALLVMVDMFCRVGLEKNLEKTKATVCTPGFI